MKKRLLLLIIPLLSFGQDLTYVPDDVFENYLETMFPESNNGISNDNYVFTDGLNSDNTNGDVFIDLRTVYYDISGEMVAYNSWNGEGYNPVTDLTGIEDMKNITFLNIENQMMSEINLNSTTFLNYDIPGGSIHIQPGPVLEKIVFPQDTLSGIIVKSGPVLSEIIFNNNMYYALPCYSEPDPVWGEQCPINIFIGDGATLDYGIMCDISPKGTVLGNNPTWFSFANNTYQIDVSDLIINNNSKFHATNPYLSQILFSNNNIYNWTEVLSVSANLSMCIDVPDLNYCEESQAWINVVTNLEDGCYNEGFDCSNINIIESTINKSLIKKTDILGRETNNIGFKLHIYDDGSVEKKYLIK